MIFLEGTIQGDLFVETRSVQATDIDALSNPFLRDWASKIMREGILDLFLIELIKAGVGNNIQEVLQFLDSVSQTTGLKKRSLLTLIDLGLRSEKKPKFFGKLLKPFGDEGVYQTCLNLGRLGHAILARVCKDLTRTNVSGNQLGFFGYKDYRANQLEFEEFKLFSNADNFNSIRSLKDVWEEAGETIRKSEDFFEIYSRTIKYLDPLFFFLKSGLGISVRPITPPESVFEKWLWINALLCWTSAILKLLEGNLPVSDISEIQIIDRRWGLSGGRIDGVQFISKDQKNFRPDKAISYSLGQLAYLLRKYDPEGALKIIEWKFIVGDNREKRQPFIFRNFSESAMTDHTRQVERYLTLGSLDEYLSRGQYMNLSDNFWHEKTLIQNGCIIYVFPASDPIIQVVTLKPDQKREVFSRDILHRWERGVATASFRDFNHRCFAFGQMVAGSDRSDNPKNVQLIIPREHENFNRISTIARVVDHHRIFLDKNNVIENQGGRYMLRLDRLISCIEKGLLKASSNFKLPQGGLVCCPVHEDKRPSFSVKPLDGFFYCFARSCKISGRILSSSIPNELKTVVNVSSWTIRKEFFKDFAVPDKHDNLLRLTHKFLQKQFFGSAGEHYVQEERRLDPDLVFEMEGGFGNSEVISNLLDAGFALEELERIGLVRYSSRVSTKRGLYELLRHRGLSLFEIRKEVNRTRDGETVFGLPYFTLEGRVTFPLKIKQCFTNIYGRSIYPNAKVPHVKLASRESGVHHGAFNEDVLYSDKCDEIIITEGVFDAISLVQMFHLEPLAVIGTRNNLITELIVRSRKNVAIALDNDRGGREDAQRLLKIFQNLSHFDGRARDFTQSFIDGLYGQEFKVRHSGISDWRDNLGWDDWNTLLITHGKWLT